ncbi:MAG: acyltransferase [Candidatus Zixiibacteriota bacterium]
MKQFIKKIIFVIVTILMLPLIVLSKIGTLLLKTNGLFEFGSQCLALVPGFIGIQCRTAYYRFTMEEFHSNCYTLFGTIFADPRVRMKPYSKTGEYDIIGLCEIGERATICSKVSILAGRYQHNFTDPTKDVFDSETVFEKIMIGDGAFIGEGALVMANVGEYSIIGAGAVVVKEIPPYSIAVGNPAKVVKDRREELKKQNQTS